MGGRRSGRIAEKDCTDDCYSIDIRHWQRDRLITLGRRFNWQWLILGEKVAAIDAKVETSQIRLLYSLPRIGESFDYPVRIQKTPCHFGGVRYWFICPAAGCSHRVALLYLRDKYFVCRHCCYLGYRSQRETWELRSYSRALKLRNKLGWIPDLYAPDGDKPKGMHWKTYNKLLYEYTINVKIAEKILMDYF